MNKNTCNYLNCKSFKVINFNNYALCYKHRKKILSLVNKIRSCKSKYEELVIRLNIHQCLYEKDKINYDKILMISKKIKDKLSQVQIDKINSYKIITLNKKIKFISKSSDQIIKKNKKLINKSSDEIIDNDSENSSDRDLSIKSDLRSESPVFELPNYNESIIKCSYFENPLLFFYCRRYPSADCYLGRTYVLCTVGYTHKMMEDFHNDLLVIMNKKEEAKLINKLFSYHK